MKNVIKKGNPLMVSIFVLSCDGKMNANKQISVFYMLTVISCWNLIRQKCVFMKIEKTNISVEDHK